MSKASGLEATQEFKIAIEEETEETINTYSTTFQSFLGLHEYSSPEMWRAALAELIATATLIFTLTISIISSSESNGSNPNQMVPVIIFVIGFVFLIVTIPLSGGHMNPTFTYIALLKGAIPFSRASVYFFAQCIIATLGYYTIKAVMSPPVAKKYLIGGCVIANIAEPSSSLSPATALVVEISCTFVMLYVGVTLGFDKKRIEQLGLPMVCAVMAAFWGMVVFVSVSVTGKEGYGGVGLNPARCLGSALVEGGQLWYGHWVFWVGPFVACTIYHLVSLYMPREDLVRKSITSSPQVPRHYERFYSNPITMAQPPQLPVLVTELDSA